MRLIADENFDNDIVRGLLRQLPALDLVRVQDVGLTGQPDSLILSWAADEQRIILTHDVNTLVADAYARVTAGLIMSGVFAVNQKVAIRQVIDDLVLLVQCSLSGEWEGQIRFIPLQ